LEREKAKIALKVLPRQRAGDKSEREQNAITNVKKRVLACVKN